MDGFFSRLALSDEQYFRLGRHLLFWIVCWTFMGFIYGFLFLSDGHYTRFAWSYLEAFIYLPQHMILSYGIIYYVLPRFIFKGRYWMGIVIVLALMLCVAFLSPFFLQYIINPIRTTFRIPQRDHVSIFYSLMAGLRGSMTVAGFAVAIRLVKLWYLKKKDNERLEKENLKAELEILKGQLHPHFMFNTLNSIYALALKKSDYTPEAILKLSQLLRYILTECHTDTVALEKEVQVLRHYIALEKDRFGNRLDITVNIQGDLHDIRIPPLLLLPLLENSFKHGVNEMIEQAWISMDLIAAGSTLQFKLINGKPIEKTPGDSSRLGLSNVKRRLDLLYPNAHELRFIEDPDTFVVVVILHLDKIETPAL